MTKCWIDFKAKILSLSIKIYITWLTWTNTHPPPPSPVNTFVPWLSFLVTHLPKFSTFFFCFLGWKFKSSGSFYNYCWHFFWCSVLAKFVNTTNMVICKLRDWFWINNLLCPITFFYLTPNYLFILTFTCSQRDSARVHHR